MNKKVFYLNRLTLACILFLFVILVSQSAAMAAQVTLAWDSNDPAPDGYHVFQRLENSNYNYAAPAWSGNATTCVIANLAENTSYYFIVRAYQGIDESGDSNEVSYRLTTTPTIYTITASAQSHGTITPSGAVAVNVGANQSFTITADPYYAISSVVVDGQSVGAVSAYTFTAVSADHTISASFTPQAYTISASAGERGSISPSGTINVNYGASRTFSISPSTGYHVANVQVDGVSQGQISTYTFSSVASNHTISASFAINTYTLSASAGSSGAITPNGTTTINYGGSQAFIISAASGYKVADVRVDGVSVGAVTSYQFSNVTANHTISATFAAIVHQITAQAGAGGSISPSGQVSVSNGNSQDFAITPQSGYAIWQVIVDGVNTGVLSGYHFEAVTANHTIEARFVAVNKPPVADAGPDQNVEEAAAVLLSGANSVDLDDGIAAFLWRQIEGPSVELQSPGDVETSFTAPQVGPEGVSLVFELQVTDQSGAITLDTCIVNVTWVNVPPTAKAGGAQTVLEGSMVVLDGSSSVDPDNGIMSYRWDQVNGPLVALSDVQAESPTFICPDVDPQGVTLTFQLTVTDSGGLQDTDTCMITVGWVNAPPNADAGPDQQVSEASEAVLDGSNSQDGDDGIAAYQWAQTDGPPVVLSDATAVSPTFTTPDAGPQGVALVFRLTVTDEGGLQNHDTCIVNVLWENQPPIASAGSDQTAKEGNVVTLDGSGSIDTDDGIATYQWSRISGPSVTLSDSQGMQPTFKAPDVGPSGAAITFKLTVIDQGGLKSEDTCIVNVTWLNQPPLANAGADQQVVGADTVRLDGTASKDNDDGIAAYRWKQISGPPVSLSDPDLAVTTFTAPTPDADTQLVFELTVTDNSGLQSMDSCSIIVKASSGPEPDTKAPEIKVTDPVGDFLFVRKSKITLKGIASDDRKVDRIAWKSDQGYSGVAKGTTQWQIVDLPLKRWLNTITLTVYDASGNKSSITVHVFAGIWR